MQGILASNFMLAIYVDILQNVSISNYNITQNEMIVNDSYYFVIPINFSQKCGLGQYYSVSGFE